MHRPPLAPKTWHDVSPTKVEKHPLEPQLGVAAGTFSHLVHGFELGLNRFCGWTTDQGGGFDGARLFKRGVAASKNQSIETISEEGSYDIRLVSEKDLESYSQSEYLWIIDKNVWGAWSDSLTHVKNKLIIPIDETTKTIETVAQILANPEAQKAEKWLIVGGGVLGDTAAFAASLAKKPMCLVPTTLLAMADACVGGKTGVNFPPYGKNQIGAFYFPKEVLIACHFLLTLSKRDLISGASECYKHAMLSGEDPLFEHTSNALTGSQSFDTFILDIIRVKSSVVEKDPAESGVRASLNFGHTLAHALEHLSHTNKPNDYIQHGEAVAIGLLFACLLSFKHLGKNDPALNKALGSLRRSKCLLSKSRLANHLGLDLYATKTQELLLESIRKDKKATTLSSGQTDWVILEDFGKLKMTQTSFTTPVDDQVIRTCWRDLLALLP
jgi:3-dehydroquinate synthase